MSAFSVAENLYDSVETERRVGSTQIEIPQSGSFFPLLKILSWLLQQEALAREIPPAT